MTNFLLIIISGNAEVAANQGRINWVGGYQQRFFEPGQTKRYTYSLTVPSNLVPTVDVVQNQARVRFDTPAEADQVLLANESVALTCTDIIYCSKCTDAQNDGNTCDVYEALSTEQ